MKDNSPKWLTVKEMLAELRIGRRALMGLIDAGEIEAFRAGSHKNSPLRFAATEPERYLRSNPIAPALANAS